MSIDMIRCVIARRIGPGVVPRKDPNKPPDRIGAAPRKAVLLCLAEHAHKDSDGAFPGVARLAQEAEMDERTVRTALSSLRCERLIVETRPATQHEPTQYKINVQALSALPLVKVDHPDLSVDPPSNIQGGPRLHSDLSLHPPRPEPTPPEPVLNRKGTIKDSSPCGEKPKPIPQKAQEHGAMFESLADICSMKPPDGDWKKLARMNAGRLNRAAKELRETGVTPGQLQEFKRYWCEVDFRGRKGQPPDPESVVKEWPHFLNVGNAQAEADQKYLEGTITADEIRRRMAQ